jgi:hypothetical protein
MGWNKGYKWHGEDRVCIICKTKFSPTGTQQKKCTKKECRKQYYDDYFFEKRYDVDLGWYKEQLDKQFGKCAICGSSEPGGRKSRFSIDHDHITKKARGLLCNKCNWGIGHFDDSIEKLDNAISYLKSNKEI